MDSGLAVDDTQPRLLDSSHDAIAGNTTSPPSVSPADSAMPQGGETEPPVEEVKTEPTEVKTEAPLQPLGTVEGPPGLASVD